MFSRILRLVRFLRKILQLVAFSTSHRSLVDPISGFGIVNLTSFGSRISLAHFTILAIGLGAVLPKEIILWISHNDSNSLSKQLIRLASRGLSIRFCDDLGPHKKWYPFASEMQPTGDWNLLIDDDVLPEADWLQTFQLESKGAQECQTVLCTLGVKTPKRGEISPYSEWATVKTGNSSEIMAIGWGGVGYPPGMLTRIAQIFGRSFQELAPRQDDIWLHWTSRQFGATTQVISGQKVQDNYFSWRIGALHIRNVGQNENDIAWASCSNKFSG